MKLNTEKSKIMIFNFTHNHQFTTRVKLDNVNLDVVNDTKLLGTHITNDLKWDLNTYHLVKRGNARMQLLRKVSTFGASVEDMKHIYTIFVRSILETSSSVWHKSLTIENEVDLERIQKSAFRIILGNNYISYENALYVLGMQTLKERRETLFTKFTLKSLQVNQMKNILREDTKIHHMNTRLETNQFKIDHTNTERLRKSAGIQMQVTVNKY